MNEPQFVSTNAPLRSLLWSSFAVVNFALGAAVLISGCASTPAEPQQMRDPQADFSAFKTFALNADTNDGEADQPVSLVDGYIRTAITTELTRKRLCGSRNRHNP